MPSDKPDAHKSSATEKEECIALQPRVRAGLALQACLSNLTWAYRNVAINTQSGVILNPEAEAAVALFVKVGTPGAVEVYSLSSTTPSVAPLTQRPANHEPIECIVRCQACCSARSRAARASA